MEHTVQRAIEVVRQGGIIIYPTDTAFGIGCRMDSTKSVDRLFSIRKRPRSQATPVLVSSREMALSYFDTPSDVVRRFMESYWPGPLTIVAPCNINSIYSPIRGNGPSIGLRMPNHPVPVGIIDAVKIPLLGPSANFHGDPTPFRFEDLNPALTTLVDYVVPGICSVQSASTVVDCSVSPYHIIRQGAVVIT
jgi:L-threonylcarbamoyladenylate synthase